MKRLEFLTQDDPLYILPLFEEFLRCYSGQFAIAQISCCRTMGSRPRLKLLKELLLLYRPLGFCRVLARLFAAKALSVLRKRPSARRYWSMRQLCRAYGIPFRVIGNPNDETYEKEMRGRSADLLVSVACPYILKKPVLSAAPLGCINIHHAPLPRYRGMMPTFWQLFNGEREVGVTVHYVTEKIDVGEPLLQEMLTVQSGESLDALIRRSKRHGAHCLARVIRDLDGPRSPAAAAAAGEGSYFTFPTPEQMRIFHQRGLRAI
jgi:methionyl-tRNA formyltransferase